MGGNSQMGGSSTVQPTSTPMTPPAVQPNGNSLASLFAGSQGYQQPNQVATITQPTYGTPALTPEQAALATQARMQARTPVTPPVVQQKQKTYVGGRGGEGGGARGASSGGNGNGWGGH